VTYNTTVIDHPPSIRVFSPLKYSFAINKTDTSMDGTDTYLMSAAHQTEVVLLFDDGLDYRETSDLLAVGGDSTSDNSCLLAAEQTTSPPQKKLPKYAP
jgi:hypothetical protein